MALVLKDRVKETSTSTGTGNFVLAGAATGFQSFASALADGDTTYYAIEDGTDWETGLGTWTESTSTLARTTVYESSNSGNAVDWGAGTKNVFITQPASRVVTSADPTAGALTKTFFNGETADISLSRAISPCPVVSVVKEVPQTGVSSKGSWDVAADGSNYDRQDTAYDTTITPSGGTFTLGTGSFAATDVGKTIVGNGGSAVLTATDGSYSVISAFNDTSTIAAGDWSMYALTFAGTDGVTLSGVIGSGFEMTNAVYDGVSFSVLGQESAPSDIFIGSSGTKLYIVGTTGDDVNEYTLSTAWDISTATFEHTFLVSAQDILPSGLFFKPDGTVMYVCGQSSDSVHEYALSTAWDVSTATFSQSYSTASEETTPDSLHFKPDGTKMYVLGSAGDDVNEYDLSTAWDISTATFVQNFSVSTQDTTPTGLYFKQDGTKMLVTGTSSDTVHEFSLSTAWDISTASSTAVFSVQTQEETPNGIFFNVDGSKMFVVGAGSDTVFQYTTLNSFVPTLAYHPAITNASGQIDTSSWTDVNSMTVDQTLNGGTAIYAISTDGRSTWSVVDDTLGTRDIVRDNSGTWQYNNASTFTGTDWVNASTNDELYAIQQAVSDGAGEFADAYKDANAWEYIQTGASTGGNSPQGIAFNNDGTKMYIVDGSFDDVRQFSLSTAFDTTTATYDSVSFSVAGQEATPGEVVFNDTGTKMYILGSTSDSVHQYSLSTAFDLSTASYDSVSFSFASEETAPTGMTFNNDGTKMFMVGATGDDVNQYSLSTAYDISTASFDSLNFALSSQLANPQTVAFSSDGLKMYAVGSNDIVFQYTLTTAFDLSTISYSGLSFSAASEETGVNAIVFGKQGTKLYVVGASGDDVNEYSVGEIVNLNRMDATQLNAVSDANHITLGDTLDLAIILQTPAKDKVPESDAVTINYDAAGSVQGAILGTDYDFSFPNSTTVRITSNAAQNLKVRVV